MALKTMSERLKSARQRKQLTQQALADSVGVSRPAITQWENGEISTLKAENLLRACTALQVRPEWLIFGERPMEPRESSIDERALTAVVVGVEDVLAAERVKLKPAKKAELYALLYHIVRENGRRRLRQRIVELVRAAA